MYSSIFAVAGAFYGASELSSILIVSGCLYNTGFWSLGLFTITLCLLVLVELSVTIRATSGVLHGLLISGNDTGHTILHIRNNFTP